MIDVELRGLETVAKYLDSQPERVENALRIAVNAAAVFGARASKKEIMRQVNFKSAYLGNPANPDSRLAVIQKAKNNDLTAIIEARARPTSLARFATSGATFGKQKAPIRVKVGKGSKVLNRAFFIKLKRGKALSADNYNIGIAIRLRPGEDVKNKKVNPSRKGNIAILYGPSIEQAFNTVSVDVSDEVLDYAEREFLRQMARTDL